MKKIIIQTIFLFFIVQVSHSQEWMKSLDIAKKLALVQNKMILMVWEETTQYQYPVFVNDDEGNSIYIRDLFTNEKLSPLIWENFVPVIVNEYEYADLFNAVKGKRKQSYIDKLNDDGIKIMDAHGNIINVSMSPFDFINITKLIEKYSLNTSYVSAELINYKEDKNFYSAYYLASKYLDFALYTNKKIRPEIIDLSNIYLKEAKVFIANEKEEDKEVLAQRCELLKIQEDLILKRPKRVLRQLKKMDAETITNNNKSLIAFLYFTAHKILKNENVAEEWSSKVSLVNLRISNLIINLNS
jgi:chaperonin cofactor prefoldin